ncbi:hypothetical protein D5F01_LYC13055 [Larimichthys crocea]|uniref:Transmembrane protein 176A n=1 Tax=Larimichthys crocea TaxID=215358 RepID=A0A6G0ICF2_LARCR|nr:hypothetical protein D5F01_LYC13055 [Larimichthys crocea]
MSVTMAKADGVTVFTLTTDPQSSCPPLCQILKGLCYSPVCFSVSQHLKRVQKSSQSVLGALHIMAGLLNIGLGAILFSGDGIYWWMRNIGLPFWSGALVILSVILNLAGVAFAITAIVLYSNSMTYTGLWWMCDDYRYSGYKYSISSSGHHEREMLGGQSTDSVLELCVSISSAVLGIKALRSSEKKENKSTDDPESCKPLLEDVTNNIMVTV